MEPVLTHSEAVALVSESPEPVAPQDLIKFISRFSWEETFCKLARIASLIANGDDGPHSASVRAVTTDLLGARLESSDARERLIAFYVRLNAPRLIAHEEVVYFLQAMTILYGADGSAAPNDEQIAFLMLAGNDYCFDWRINDGALTSAEHVMAASVRSMALFNHEQDTLRDFVRSNILLGRPPPRTKEWKQPNDWNNFQTRAFGISLDEYTELLAGPLFIMSTGWGTRNGGAELLRSPVVTPESWIAQLGLPRDLAMQFFARTSASRDDLKTMLAPLVGTDHLPRGSSVFYRKPFLRLSSGRLVAASPWVVREQVRGAAWASLLAQAKKEFGDDIGAERWFSAFGDLFELWCRDVAKIASESITFRGELILSKAIGEPNEVEDVAILDGNKLTLISAKASTIPERSLKTANSAAELLAWFERFLFHRRSGKRRAGAMRLLNDNIQRVRAGIHESQGVSKNVEIFPAIVTYDHVGADNPGFYMWLSDRCREEGLLQQPGVHPPVLIHVDTFELLMGFAATGRSIFDVLEQRGPEERLDVALRDNGSELGSLRLPAIRQHFDRLMQRMINTLRSRALSNAHE